MICHVFLRKGLPGKMDVSGKVQPVLGFIFGIAAKSGETGTTMSLSFQINHFIHQVQG